MGTRKQNRRVAPIARLPDGQWRTHTPRLLQEIINNNQTAILKIPIQIFARQLAEVAKRASVLNDPELNRLMGRLTLYDETDPDSKDYNQKTADRILKTGKR